MIEHIEKRRTLYRVHSTGCDFFPWAIQKWRWWFPMWIKHKRFVLESHAHDHMERMQRNQKYYEL